MKIDVDVHNDRCCNECHSQNNIKIICLGNMEVALCEDCREKLHGMLYNDWEGENREEE